MPVKPSRRAAPAIKRNIEKLRLMVEEAKLIKELKVNSASTRTRKKK